MPFAAIDTTISYIANEIKHLHYHGSPDFSFTFIVHQSQPIPTDSPTRLENNPISIVPPTAWHFADATFKLFQFSIIISQTMYTVGGWCFMD
jgi:hypothetical protein